MLNISPQELLLILLIALLVVGPRRLPELGRSLGKGIRELRKAQEEVRKTIQINLDEEPPATTRRPAVLPEASSAGDGEDSATADVGGAGTDAAGAAAASGASDVSEVSRSLGRGISELRRARKEIQRTFRVDLNEPRSKRPATSKPVTSEPASSRSASSASAPSGSASSEDGTQETATPDDLAGDPVAGSPPE
jgi:sec-independent protein translocase protein TatA